MSDLVDQILGKVTGDMDIFKKIASKIPGFSGYMERQNRRDSDKMLRETIASRIEEQWAHVSGLQRDFISQGQISYVDDLEAAAIKLRTFADRIRRAPRGYSGLFDAVKINEKELESIYQFDYAFFDLAEQVGRALDNVEASLGDETALPAAIRNVTSLARMAVETYNRRSEAVTGSGK